MAGKALNKYLMEKWNTVLPKYNPNLATSFKTCAIIVDSTSLEIEKPKQRFRKSKIYYDKRMVYIV